MTTTATNPTLAPSMTFTEAEIDELTKTLDLRPSSIEMVKLALTTSYREIARLKEIPVGTVRSRIHRTRKALSDARGPLPVSA